MSRIVEEDQIVDAKTERQSGKSGSVEAIGFGCTRKHCRSEGKEVVGGSGGGERDEEG